jgi:hypothetical protein
MECPYCGAELEWDDYYGFYLGNDNWDKQGDIYKCLNEDCESGAFNNFFHTDKQENLYEGYPC